MNEEMNFSGLTDLPERAAQDCDRCRCGSFARVASGLCVSCLLRSGLDSNEANIEDFDTLLAAVDIPDRDWQLVATVFGRNRSRRDGSDLPRMAWSLAAGCGVEASA
jgi:hypothetical protein